MPPLRSTGFVDPGWEHGIAQDERKKKVKCNYCGKVVSGGIYRLKQHLARISGEVTYCDKAPEEVYLKMKENLEGYRSSKKLRRPANAEHSYLNFHSNYEEEAEDAGYTGKGKQLIDDRSLVINLAPLRSLGYVDPGWEHGDAQDERKKKVKCKYCEKIVSGGINRFKQHLARIPGEVAPCKSAPEEVYLKIKENMKWHRTGRRHRRLDAKEISAFYMPSDNEDEEDELEEGSPNQMNVEKVIIDDKTWGANFEKASRGMYPSSGSGPLPKRSRLDSVVLHTPRSQIQQFYKQPRKGPRSSKKSRKDVFSAICKFFYHAGVPSHAANSPYFHRMLELVGQFGQGLIGPSSQLISGQFLQDEIATIRNYLVEYKASWESTGCSIMADSWQDTQGRTLINFLVSCSCGVYFLSSVDATNIVEDPSNLFNLLDQVVEDINEENVVQVITQNTPAYKAAGKMLEEKRRNLFWTPCAVYCIDRMLEDFVKIKCVRECMEKGQKITKFLYNQIGLINLMKKEFTGGQELLRPAITRYASSFATLQNLMDHRSGLKRMFLSERWRSSGLSKSEDGKEVEKIVLSASFWKKVHHVQKSVDPLVLLLQKLGSDEKFSMASVYNDMYRAKLAIKSIHGDDLCKYGPFWNVMDSHWNSLFHHPLYTAAYFLNPSLRYRSDFVALPEVMRGVNECIVRLEPVNERRISASLQISDFNSAKADFGTELAVGTRTEIDPAAWWQQHGINCLELQRIAIRILSQTCSSIGCEHNWSIYDQIHRQSCSRLAQKRLNDVMYVHYNLRLRQQQFRKMTNDSGSLDSVLIENLLEDWIAEKERHALQEDEEILYNEMESVVYESEVMELEEGAEEGHKMCYDTMSFGDAEPLHVVNHACAEQATDDEDEDADTGLNFLEDGLSE